jgi:hypothetical protein
VVARGRFHAEPKLVLIGLPTGHDVQYGLLDGLRSLAFGFDIEAEMTLF